MEAQDERERAREREGDAGFCWELITEKSSCPVCKEPSDAALTFRATIAQAVSLSAPVHARQAVPVTRARLRSAERL